MSEAKLLIMLRNRLAISDTSAAKLLSVIRNRGPISDIFKNNPQIFNLVMGRIKTTPVKRITLQLFKEHKKEFKQDFEENKKSIDKFLEQSSKPIRNKVAGYMTRLMKKGINTPRAPSPKREKRRKPWERSTHGRKERTN